jgi:hypothetical protein
MKKGCASTFKVSHAPYNELVKQALIKLIFVDVFHVHFDLGKSSGCLDTMSDRTTTIKWLEEHTRQRLK